MQQEVLVVLSAVGGLTLLALLARGGYVLYHRFDAHHISHESMMLQRLSEILVAINKMSSSDDGVKETMEQREVTNTLLLEIRHELVSRKQFDELLAEFSGVGIAVRDLADNKAAAMQVYTTLNSILGAVDRTDVQVRRDEENAENLQHLVVAAQSILERVGGKGAGLLHADIQGVITKFDEFQLFLSNLSAKNTMAIDAIGIDLEKFVKQQKDFQNVLFNGGSIQSTDDETGVEEEKIQTFMRRYGITREAATERVRGSAAYETVGGRGMGGRA